ncbi:alpha/beta fold hydrolase [Pleomorphomonas sp. JP5]|uniref:alpha/beta fold hydrolase n=1 Tax=Pleomorphomonas sp. JP5 TaxID=2942998 RepID=UPI0020438C90|nr:alpha/beta fold hydrolase [Pleomorphomonas sp. JP5]MCM5557066.1 alpha/beta fold hydrolase [Pleomorphomonas sp. JP5]
MTQTSTFILVHGANLGGWCWQDVRAILEAHGHDVLSPSLNLSLTASLDQHIAEVTELIVSRDLHGIVLVGHSYGGMVITGVADRVRSRIARLVYLDAAVPGDGDDFASHIPDLSAAEAEARRAFYRSLSADGLWLAPPPLQLVGITDADAIASITPRLVPHPLATWLQPVRLQNGGTAGLPKTYILATNPPTDVMGYPRHGEAAKEGGEWTYREIQAGHALMLAAPNETAALLMEAAANAP